MYLKYIIIILVFIKEQTFKLYLCMNPIIKLSVF